MDNMAARWYILHTVSGSENRVKQMIKDQIAKQNMSDQFEDIVVPVIEVPEVKRGKRVMTEKKFMPGYILIRMHMTDESWHLVKSVPKISGFLGSKTQPRAMSDEEVSKIFKQVESASKNATSLGLYNVGDRVRVVDGPFDSFSGVVEGVDADDQKLKISVSIFGKATPIELNFSQVKKID